MPTIERVIPLVGQLPDPIREMVTRRLRELSGLGLLGLAGVAAAALMTWSVQDPSLSHATAGKIRNLMGYPGAIGADLMMQIMGLGAIMAILPVAIWGWRMMTHRPFDREALRISSWILCAVLAAGLFSCWPRTGAWPLPSGLGGVVGDALVRAPAVMFGPPGTVYRLVLGTILFVTMTASFLFAVGLGASATAAEAEITANDHDDDAPLDEEDDGAVSLGWLMHGLLSLKARIGRMSRSIFGLLLARREATASRSFERREPNLGGRSSPSIAPHEDDEYEQEPDDEDEAEEEEAPAARARKRAPKAPPPRKSSGTFVLPPLSVLTAGKASDRKTLSNAELQENSTMLEGVLQDFGVRGEITNARPGPVVTLYELEPAPGIKSSRVIGLADDIARSMSALSARVAVVPGRNAIGIELPNEYREKVYLRELLAKENSEFDREAAALPWKKYRRRAGDRGPCAHAASADRRHHRLRQIRRDQHDDPEPGLPAAPRSVPVDHGRSEDARIVRL